jgi:hypothetical protein
MIAFLPIQRNQTRSACTYSECKLACWCPFVNQALVVQLLEVIEYANRLANGHSLTLCIA